MHAAIVCVTVLNPVVVVVQGRCTSVKRVLTPRSCDRVQSAWSDEDPVPLVGRRRVIQLQVARYADGKAM